MIFQFKHTNLACSTTYIFIEKSCWLPLNLLTFSWKIVKDRAVDQLFLLVINLSLVQMNEYVKGNIWLRLLHTAYMRCAKAGGWFGAFLACNQNSILTQCRLSHLFDTLRTKTLDQNTETPIKYKIERIEVISGKGWLYRD